MHSAARTRTECGVLASTIVFSRVVAAAGAACCSLATDCEKVARRAARNARIELGLLHPAQKGFRRDLNRGRCLFDVPVRQEGGDCVIHLAFEFGPVAGHLGTSAF
jgi:hypothetical protein